MSRIKFEEARAQLQGIVSDRPDSFRALCPAHDDHNPSLSVTRKGGDREYAVFHCHAGCAFQDIEAALNGHGPRIVLRERLVPKQTGQPRESGLAWLAEYTGIDTDFLKTQELGFVGDRIEFRFGATGRKCRKAGTKNFWWDKTGSEPPLWPVPDQSLPDTVYLTAGETDCLCLRYLGYAAFALTKGEKGTPPAEVFEALRAQGVATIRYLADTDSQGIRAIAPLRSVVESAGIGLEVLDLRPHLNPLLGEKDVRDLVRRLLGKPASIDEIRSVIDDLTAITDDAAEERFPSVDLSLDDDVPAREMLVERLLYKRCFHVLHGESGDGKTMVGLALAARLLKEGLRVAYLDEENGEDEIKKRLIGLGVSGQARQDFLYLPQPSPTLREAEQLVARIVAFEPVLVIFDSGADFYVAAQLDENAAVDMVAWATALPQRLAKEFGIASLLLEHQNAEHVTSRPRGSTAKKQKADVTWHVSVTSRFDQNSVGAVEFGRTKDRFGSLPLKRTAEIGGDGKGGIVFVLKDAVTERDEQIRQAQNAAAKRRHFYEQIEKVLFKEGAFDKEHGLSKNVLTRLLPAGTAELKRRYVEECADDPLTHVRKALGSRSSIVFWLVRPVRP
jgi:hypothetical protein